MPTKNSMLDMVASQMIRCGKPNRLKVPDSIKNSFIKRHEKQILWAIENLPRSSAALHAVVVKCIIKYKNNERIVELAKALKFGKFQGKNDPAHLLYKYLQARKGYDFVGAYRICVAACEAYMENKQLSKITPTEKDIFDWDEGYTVPDELLSGWNPDEVPQSADLTLQTTNQE